MDAFAYLSVLLSIILGLGLTQLLTAVGRLIRHRDRVRIDWLPLLWAAVLLVIYVQVWWAMFGLRQVRVWTFFEFLIVLGQVVALYMMAPVALPEQVDEVGVDLGAYFDSHRHWFFGFFLATLVISVSKDVVLAGHLPSGTNLAFHVVLAAVSVGAMTLRRRRAQELLGVVGAATVAVYIGLLFTRLQ